MWAHDYIPEVIPWTSPYPHSIIIHSYFLMAVLPLVFFLAFFFFRAMKTHQWPFSKNSY